MANPLPPMSPMRTIAGGEVVPPASEPTPITIAYTAEELATSHRRATAAKAQQEAFSPTPARLWLNGALQPVPQQTYAPVPPPQDASLAPRRVLLEGSPLERPAAPLVDLRVQRQQALEEARRQNLADAARGTYQDHEGRWVPYPDEMKKAQQRIENQHAKGEHYCRTHGLAVLPTEAEYYRGEFVFKADESAPPVPPEVAP